jgi:sn-glycerol 3-phosphate transport system substrate-binding protein
MSDVCRQFSKPSRRQFLAAGAAIVGSAVAVGALGTASPPASVPVAARVADVTFDLWHIFAGALGTAFTGLLGEFTQANPGIKINPVYVPYAAVLQTALSAIAAGQPPAMAVTELTLMANLAAQGALTPLKALNSASTVENLRKSFTPSVAEANSYRGVSYTVPLGYNSNQLYYNPDLVKQAGLDPDQDLPKTWSELIEVAPKLTKNRTSAQQADVWGYVIPSNAPQVLEVRFWQCGAQIFNQAGTKPLFQGGKGQAMFEKYQQLVRSKGATYVTTDATLSQTTDLFTAGKAALFEQSSTAILGLTSAAGFEIGVSSFPTMGHGVFSMGGYNLGIFNGAAREQQQAANEFARWWVQPEIAARWTSVSNYLPGVTAAWDTSTLKNWLAADPRRRVAADQLPKSRPRPNLPQYPQISVDIVNAFDHTMLGQTSARAALDEAAAQAKESLE